MLRVRMRLRQRKMPEHETQLVAQVTAYSLDEWVGAGAMRTLEVSVLNEGHRRGGGTNSVILLVHCNR